MAINTLPVTTTTTTTTTSDTTKIITITMGCTIHLVWSFGRRGVH